MKYDEISHFSHPQHKLKFENSEILFQCDGCKEVGIGPHYRCAACNFDLHVHCGIPSPSIYHPFYTKCSFQFLSRPPGDMPRYCEACKKVVTGFVYHCKASGFDLHPCCAKLPMVLDNGEVKLSLHSKVSASCQKCGRKGKCWSYRSACKKYNLHVACVLEISVENWHEYFGRGNGSSWELETRIPSLNNTTLQTYHQRGTWKKVKKWCKLGRLALQIVISTVLGDPTGLFAGVIGSLSR
ncbi:hypothetical protein SLE2022_087450 [Rubroshorea leprosula]